MNKEIFTSFVITGVVFVTLFVLFFILGEDWKKTVSWILVFVFALFLLLGVTCLISYKSAKEWNGGYCQCGGVWEQRKAIKNHPLGSVTRYYECSNCHTEMIQK
jgi:hypothetical protein